MQQPLVATAQELNPDTLQAAIRIYKTVAKCEYCHGWHGEHGELYDLVVDSVRDPGPSLVASTLDRDAMIEVVSCGMPKSNMPRYLPGAWTEEHRCYGMVATDLERAQMPPRVEVLLSARQIETVVDYVRTVYQGTGMTLEDCMKYYTPTHKLCDRYR